MYSDNQMNQKEYLEDKNQSQNMQENSNLV